jgi:hypothetical protein
MPKEDDPTPNPDFDPDDLDALLESVLSEGVEYEEDIKRQREKEMQVIDTLHNQGLEEAGHLKDLLNRLPPDKDLFTHMVYIRKRIARMKATPEERATHLQDFDKRFAHADWIILIANELEMQEAGEEDPVRKQALQAKILTEEGLDQEWKDALVESVDKLLTGVSITSLDEGERLLLIANANMQKSQHSLEHEFLNIAERIVHEALSKYSDYREFGRLVNSVAAIAVFRYSNFPEAKTIIGYAEDNLRQIMKDIPVDQATIDSTVSKAIEALDNYN